MVVCTCCCIAGHSVVFQRHWRYTRDGKLDSERFARRHDLSLLHEYHSGKFSRVYFVKTSNAVAFVSNNIFDAAISIFRCRLDF